MLDALARFFRRSCHTVPLRLDRELHTRHNPEGYLNVLSSMKFHLKNLVRYHFPISGSHRLCLRFLYIYAPVQGLQESANGRYQHICKVAISITFL